MAINWQDLRPLNNSLYTAFEELCCQLAAYEKMPNGATFIRKGAPDAGVESYWKLLDESEWALQAKFFLSPPDDGQWAQVDGSVKTALEKHPQLSRYVVCFPIDRQDPRVPKRKSFMDKWNDRVKVWQGWASAKGMKVQFEYWGEHEIFERLSRDEHRGRFYFWFHRDLFSGEWFRNRAEEAIANVGPRYTPELDVQLPIAMLFDGLARTAAFFDRVKRLLSEVKKHHPNQVNEHVREKAEQLNVIVRYLIDTLNVITPEGTSLIEWGDIGDSARRAAELARECAEALRVLVDIHEKAKQATEHRQDIERVRYLSSGYWRLHSALLSLMTYAEGIEATLTNIPALLLVADAGKGKTHLLCDVTKHRVEAGLPTVLLIGGQFNTDEPWAQMLRLLGLTCSKDEFIGALEAAAQAQRSKALILIDALNEGQGKTLWKKHLGGMLTTLSRSPWLSIAFSVRTSYEDTIVPEGLVAARLVRAVHHGFAEHEYEATKTFFGHYGIESPRVPLMVPEFQNPLFLKVFCLGLHNSGLTKIPSGLQGITAIFDFFIDSVNKKLSDAEYLNFHRRYRIVWKAVEAFVAKLAAEGKDWLSIEVAQEVINSILPRDGYENSLYHHLIAEGVIAENRFYIHDTNEHRDGTHFAYERFTDHLIAKYLLDQHLDANNLNSPFEDGQPLNKFVVDYYSCAINRGLIEAFSIQIPERIGKEFVELAPDVAHLEPIIEAFVDSIVWRNPDNITQNTTDYVNERVLNSRYAHERFLNALLTVASNPSHPYNAEFLHRNLKTHTLAGRDAWWSIFLQEQFQSHDAVDRLLEWAWTPIDKQMLEGNAVRLSAIALAWYLTSSNRFLRDRATKALVCLLTKRLPVLGGVLNEFWDVNDPYVLERLLAVAYGCALRSVDKAGLAALAQQVYDQIFKDSKPPVHILIRDYARGVIEVAIHRGITIEGDIEKARPPYSSDFPEIIPSEEELKEKFYNLERLKTDADRAQLSIWASVMSFGDFARYIIGTDRGSLHWSSLRLNEEPEPTRKEKFDELVASLTQRQKSAFEKYQTIRNNVSYCRRLDQERRVEVFGYAFTNEDLDAELARADANVRRLFGRKKAEKLTDELIHFIDYPHEEEHQFHTSIAQRWILNRVFELGWTVEKFGNFDWLMNYRDGRSSHKTERIGKKYQWIAYHEFLALVSDNFVYRGDYWGEEEPKVYQGPWQGRAARNIDPSWVLPNTKTTTGWRGFTPTWWAPQTKDWDDTLSVREWMRDTSDLPPIPPQLSITKPDDRTQWLVLDVSPRWESPNDEAEDEETKYPRKDVQYFVDSYIVKKSNAPDFMNWAKTQWLGNQHALPDTHSLSDVFFGEYFWAPAFKYFNVPYFLHHGWIGGEEGDNIPTPIVRTSDHYTQSDQEYDCSIDEEGVAVYMPSKWMADNLKLEWRGVDGSFFDEHGELIAFDPSVHTVGPGALLVKRDALLTFLDERDLALVWVVAGEKLVVTGGMSGDDWPGRLLIAGVYTIKNGHIVGEVNTRFEGRE